MKTLPALVGLLLLLQPLHAHEAAHEIAKAVQTFVSGLDDEQKSKASFPFPGEPNGERTNWHFIPRTRLGLPLKAMSVSQQQAAKALLKLNLSESGFQKAESIRDLENVLKELENNNASRDSEMYFVSVFGNPSPNEPWSWRWEGHHLSLNFTFVPGAPPAMTPSFMGSNPGEVPSGPKAGLRVLAKEEDLARTLMKSLDEAQFKRACIPGEAPKDIFNVPGRNDTKAEGISYSALNASQQKQLAGVINEYLFRARPDIAKAEWARVQKAGLENLHFAWMGSIEPGQPHYYRVQLKNFVLEYDNTQNNAKHVHALWRDFDHDFGADALAEHYKKHPH